MTSHRHLPLALFLPVVVLALYAIVHWERRLHHEKTLMGGDLAASRASAVVVEVVVEYDSRKREGLRRHARKSIETTAAAGVEDAMKTWSPLDQHLPLPNAFKFTENGKFVYLVEAILNYKLSSVTLFPLTPGSFYDFYKFGPDVPYDSPKRRHLEINFEWRGDDEGFNRIGLRNHTQLIDFMCEDIPFIRVEWEEEEEVLGGTRRTRSVQSKKCQAYQLNGGNVMNRVKPTQYTFDYDEFVVPIRKLARQRKQQRVRVVLLEPSSSSSSSSTYPSFDISLRTRSSPTSLMSVSRRDEEESVNALDSSARLHPHTISACLARTSLRSPYTNQFVWYQLHRLHFSHVYVSVQDGETPEELASQVGEIRTRAEDDGLNTARFTVVAMKPRGTRVYGAGKYFQNVCYWHARDLDSFVGIWDMDEIPVFSDARHDEIFAKYLPRKNVLFDYLNDIVREGKHLVSWTDTVRFSKGALKGFEQTPLRYFARPLNEPLPSQNISDFSQFCLAGYQVYSSASYFKSKGAEATGLLAKDFPVRSRDSSYFDPPKHAKCVGITSTLNTVEIHKHTNSWIKGKFNQRTPYESRILLDPDVLAMHHFYDVFVTRSGRPGRLESDPPEEFATRFGKGWEEFLLSSSKKNKSG